MPAASAAPAIDEARLQVLKAEGREEGDYVLYWMQQSGRAEENHALEYAAGEANRLGQPLVVAFGLMDDYPEANARHYFFMLQGLAEAGAAIQARGADFLLQHGHPAKVAAKLAQHASLVVCDRGYTRHQRAWRTEVAEAAPCRVVQVECDVVVPVHFASQKLEFAARTIRPKIYKALERFLPAPPVVKLQHAAKPLKGPRLEHSDPEALLAKLKVNRSVSPVPKLFPGGTHEAKRRFRAFCKHKLAGYAELRNQPETDDVSRMSAYLHFGQISPAWMVREVREQEAARGKERGLRDSASSYVEELTVRRELGMNFVEFNPKYDEYAGLPEWARKTLAEHTHDGRPKQYTREQLEHSRTHDPYWNAAMKEMRLTGYLHNHLRMYWGKKILEWSADPAEGFAHALYLNNKYFLCGRDPASFANVAWVFGQHDRPWGEREIYGKVRCMMASGLERKCDIKAYLRRVDAMAE